MTTYHVIVMVRGEGFHLDLEVPGPLSLRWAERVAETYVKHGYRHPEPDGWVYYPTHVIQTITIKRRK